MTIFGRWGDEGKGILLKRPGGAFVGGKAARRAFRRHFHRFRRGGVYIINPPEHLIPQMQRQTGAI